MPAAPLPLELIPAFTVTQALDAGVPRQRLRAKDLAAPFHGTRATRELTDLQRLSLLLTQLPSHSFACGLTAAAVHALPLTSVQYASAFGRLSIGVPLPAARIRRPGVLSRALRVEPSDVVETREVRVLSPLRTWVELSGILTVGRFVAVTDHLISRRSGHFSVQDLTTAHLAFARGPGARMRQTALQICTPNSESPRESELRALIVLAGLPAPAANVEIYDGARFVARVDLLYRSHRVIIEYDGDHHRDPAQWSRDQSRRAELESLGYRVTVVTARDFDDPARLVARIRRLLDAG